MAAALRVQATANSGAGVTLVATLSSVQSGDLLVACFRERDGTTINSVSDDVNGAWTVAVTRSVTAAQIAVYYLQNSAAGSPQVTVTFSGGSVQADGNFSAWSGVVTASALDATNSAGNTAATTHSPGSITPSAAALVLSCAGFGADHGGGAPATGFTALNVDGGATVNRQIYSYKVTHTGAITASNTSTNAVNSDACVASFLEASVVARRFILVRP